MMSPVTLWVCICACHLWSTIKQRNAATIEAMLHLGNCYCSGVMVAILSPKQVANPFGEGLKRSERRLPERRTAAYASLNEDTAIPRGFMSADQIVEILAQRREDSAKWTPPLIADKYGVDIMNVEQLLKHFNTFQVIAKLKMDTELKSSPD